MQEETNIEPKDVDYPTYKVVKVILQAVHHVHLDVVTMPSFQRRILGMLNLPKNDGKNLSEKRKRNINQQLSNWLLKWNDSYCIYVWDSSFLELSHVQKNKYSIS